MTLMLEERVTDLEGLIAQLVQTLEQNAVERRLSQRRIDAEIEAMARENRQAQQENQQAQQRMDKIIVDMKEENQQLHQQAQQRTDKIIVDMKEENQQLHQQAQQRTDKIIVDMKEENQQSLQRLEAIVAETSRENRQVWQRIDEALTRSKAETDQIIAEIRTQISEDRAKTDQIIAEIRTQISEDRAKTDREIRNSRRQSGELSNRLGTLVEDLIVPSIPRIVYQVVKLPDEFIERAIRVKRRDVAGKEREFDAIAVCGPYLLINETKSRLSPDVIDAFVQILPNIRQYFPEYVDKHIIGLVSSLYVDESLVRYGQRQGLVVLGFGEDVMDVLNSPDFQPKLW